MIEIRQAKFEDKGLTNDLLPFISLYQSAFPLNERRCEWHCPKDVVEFLEIRKDVFNILLAYRETKFVGFLTYWGFGDFVYVEHLAVEKHYRGQKIGSQLVEWLKHNVGNRIILEVELPENETQKDRIKFYSNLGFRAWQDVEYEQPSYSADQSSIKLMLMTHGNFELKTRDGGAILKIKRQVYGV